MISALDLVKQYHTPSAIKNDDLLNIEKYIIKAATGGFRETTYGIVTERYSTVMNALKELGYSVSTDSQVNNITILKITW